jgi:TonB family protein
MSASVAKFTNQTIRRERIMTCVSSYFRNAAAAIFVGLIIFSQALAQDAARQKIIRKSSDALRASAIDHPEPKYPPLAKTARVAGAVIVEVTVDEEGNVIAARVISGHPLLKDAALAAARNWTFAQTKIDGFPVIVLGTINFDFSLDNARSSQDANNKAAIDRTDEKDDESDIEDAKKAVNANPLSAQAHFELGQAYADED